MEEKGVMMAREVRTTSFSPYLEQTLNCSSTQFTRRDIYVPHETDENPWAAGENADQFLYSFKRRQDLG
jgi:hypothetical protein